MKPVTELFEQKGFLKNLFEAIPCGVLVVDGDRRVKAINNVVERTFGLTMAEALNKRGGEALRCIHSETSPEGCGYADECQECQVRKTALEALSGMKIHRHKAKAQLWMDGKICDLQFLISAAPVEHNGEKLAIVLLEDITELNNLRKRLKTEHCFAGIIGRDPRMQELYETIRDVADINVPILIQGESGTGKELVASAIHSEGPRAHKPFVPVNCAALPEGVLESELFGHVKGAFTGALRDKKGRFELADGGTLFLDEVSDMPRLVQAKLLRVLQEGKFERVGDEKTISVNVRIISATNRPLKAEVERGRFREDLYYRLNVVPIYLPPLRKRKGDILLLVDYFLARAKEEGQGTEGVSKDALAMMIDYPWPGNVRELQSALRFALVKSKGGLIQSMHLPLELKEWQKPPVTRGPSRKLELETVRDALARSGGNKVKAARSLGVGRATLYRFLIDFPDVS
ncbi:MAG: sigma 54-interacting transcriptional regulator [Deltaproteobacteria bacterium]|nr:sigma 54-interacting transcriptional regulator [Deltaproteobacteria bacterium]